MKHLRMALWLLTVFPLVLCACVLSIPYVALCRWAGEGDELEVLLGRVSDRLADALRDFADPERDQ